MGLSSLWTPGQPPAPHHCAQSLWTPDLGSSPHFLPKNSLPPTRPLGLQGCPFPLRSPQPHLCCLHRLLPSSCGLGATAAVSNSTTADLWDGPGLSVAHPPVLVSHDCQRKLPEWAALKHWHFSLTIVETRSPKSRCGRAMLPPKAPGEGLFCLFQLLGALGFPLTYGLITLVSASSSLSHGLLCI